MKTYPHDIVVPFGASGESKKEQVKSMFDRIAFRYDFMNRFLSAGIDRGWRKKAIKMLKEYQPRQILDVATGTADFALMSYELLHPQKITGIDISKGMLALGRDKVKKAGLEQQIELIYGDSEAISYSDHSFDAITVAFGVRNFENLEQGLLEMKRVLRVGGKLVILECTQPNAPVVKPLFRLYMNYITPIIGKWVAKNKNAYTYLNESVRHFPEKNNFIHILNDLGYRNAFYKTMTLGTCTIYCAEK